MKQGWYEGSGGMPPLRDEVLREQARARFTASRMDLAARLAEEHARGAQDAILQRATDGTSMRLLQSMADASVSELAQLGPALIRQAMGVLVQQQARTPKEARNNLRALGTAMRAVVAVKSRATELERLVLGDPTEIIKVTDGESVLGGDGAPDDMAMVEAEMEAATRALDLARADAGRN